MANEIAGYKGVFGFSTSTGGTIREVGSLRNFSIDQTHATINVTSHDSSGHKEIIGGITEWSGTAEFMYVTASTYHKALADLVGTKVKVDSEFYPTGSSSDGYWSGTMYFTNWGLNSPNEDVLASNVSFEGTAVLARTSSST